MTWAVTPARASNYTAGDPAQTSIAAFQSGGAEAYVNKQHWSSTEGSSTTAWKKNFSAGQENIANGKETADSVRAFRKITL